MLLLLGSRMERMRGACGRRCVGGLEVSGEGGGEGRREDLEGVVCLDGCGVSAASH